MTESNLESQQSKSSKGKKRKSTLPRTLREALREGYRANEEKMTFESRDMSKRRGILNVCIWEGEEMWGDNCLKSIFIPFTATYTFGRPRLKDVDGRKGHLSSDKNPRFDPIFAAKCVARLEQRRLQGKEE
jgi:hypothetical protein